MDKPAEKSTYKRCERCGAFLEPMRDSAGKPVSLLGYPMFRACEKCGLTGARPKSEAN